MTSTKDFSKYAIKQANYKDTDPPSKYLPQVVQLIASSFSGICPIESAKNYVAEVIENNSTRSQLLFLVDTETDTVVSFFECIIKNTDLPSVINCTVSAVCTRADYRKMGLMEYLLNEGMKKYEDPDYKFTGSDQHDQDGIETFIKRELSGSTCYWTLYSSVGGYYSRFGFKAVKDFDLLNSPPMTLSEVPNDFNLLENEHFLSRNDVVSKLESSNYLPDLKSTKPYQRSVSLKTPSFVDSLIDRNISYLRQYNKAADTFGLSISTDDNENETFVVVSGQIHGARSVIGRLFTTVKDKELLICHLRRLVEFIAWHLKNYNNVFPFIDNEFGDVTLIVNDIFTTDELGDISDSETDVRKFIVSWLRDDQGWTYDDSNTLLLPMMKDFGRDGFDDNVEWIHNGVWCMN